MKPLLQIGKIGLEPAEGGGGGERQFRSFEHIVGAGILDKHVAAPEVPFRIPPERFPGAGRHHFKRPAAAAGIGRAFAPDFSGDVGSHPHEVLHQRLRIAENAGVDPLEDVAVEGSTLIVGHSVSIVDMAGSERDSDHKLSIKPEFGTDGAEIALHSHFILSIAYNEPWFNICLL